MPVKVWMFRGIVFFFLDEAGIDGLGFLATGKPQFAKFVGIVLRCPCQSWKIQKNWEGISVLGVWRSTRNALESQVPNFGE